MQTKPQRWTEAQIGKALAHQLLNGRSVLVIPNCQWTGHECDLLVIERGLRVIDVEIKISRADLKADIHKAKWWNGRPWRRQAITLRGRELRRREWPEKVWKHYYALPQEIWRPELLESIPATSGVLLLCAQDSPSSPIALRVIRRAKPNGKAKQISPQDAVDLARLASLRMWAALSKTGEPSNEL